MRGFNRRVQLAFCLTMAIALGSSSPASRAGTASLAAIQNAKENHGLTIVDRSGRAVPDAPASPGQIVDVTVGPSGTLTFSPSTVNIITGDTVRWTWAGSNHTVTSGTPCTVDSAYCSTTDASCTTAPPSNSGTVYTHTFTQAGTFHYFCRIHCSFGMTGTVVVTAPTVNITSVSHTDTGHFIINGQSVPNAAVTISSSPDLITSFGSPSIANTDASGVFHFDSGVVAPQMQFYRASYP